MLTRCVDEIQAGSSVKQRSDTAEHIFTLHAILAGKMTCHDASHQSVHPLSTSWRDVQMHRILPSTSPSSLAAPRCRSFVRWQPGPSASLSVRDAGQRRRGSQSRRGRAARLWRWCRALASAQVGTRKGRGKRRDLCEDSTPTILPSASRRGHIRSDD